MYLYANMLTRHWTQSNVNQLMIHLCMTYKLLEIFYQNNNENLLVLQWVTVAFHGFVHIMLISVQCQQFK